EVGYDSSRRLALELRPAPLNREGQAALELGPSAVVLITGGARGITAQVARQLAEQYQPTLLLVGRSALPEPKESIETAGLTSAKELKAALMEQFRSRGQPVTLMGVEEAHSRLMAQREIRSNIEVMRRLGGTVHYYSVDVRDSQAFGNLIDQIYDTFGRLDGVVH